MTGPNRHRVTSRASLDRSEKFAFARHAAVAQVRELPGALKVALGYGSPDSALALHVDPPDGKYAHRAHGLAEEVYGPELFQHCLRCWYLGDLFAQRERRAYNPELFYVACLMHDIALSDSYRTTRHDMPCFAVHGGDVANRTLRTWGADKDFCRTVDEAIAAHLDVTTPPENGVEAYLLHAAARLDVAGARVSEIPRPLLRRINTLHPRTNFVSTFSRTLSREAREHPDSRIAVLWKLGMRIVIALNPASIMFEPSR
jgi:hypothetical protein